MWVRSGRDRYVDGSLAVECGGVVRLLSSIRKNFQVRREIDDADIEVGHVDMERSGHPIWAGGLYST